MRALPTLPTLTLPVAPGEYAFLQLPRHLSADEYACVTHLLEVMSPGFLKEPVQNAETTPVEEYVAVQPSESDDERN